MEVKGVINKRASKRYTYLPQARIEAPNISQNVQIRDISHSGIQFFSNLMIPQQTPLIATWREQNIGSLVPFVMVVRKIEHRLGMTYRYCYGSQFFNLRNETKLNIQKLLDQSKVEEIESNKNLMEKIGVNVLINIIKNGRAYLQNILGGHDQARLFHRFTRDIKEYEVKSFLSMNEDAQQIQKLATNTFHCNLLNIAVPFTPKNTSIGFEFYKETVNKIEQVTASIIESRKFAQFPLVMESSNRLYYNKLELLQTFVQAYESGSFSSDAKSEPIKKIVDEYRQTSSKTPPRIPPKPRL